MELAVELFKDITHQLAHESGQPLVRVASLMLSTKYGKALPPLDANQVAYILGEKPARIVKLFNRLDRRIAYLSKQSDLKAHCYKDGIHVLSPEKLVLPVAIR